MNNLIALLGRGDAPTDALEDYCHWLAQALGRAGQPMEILRVPWAERGWFRAVAWLWRESRHWRGRWVVLQYTALGWSRRGIPFGALWVLRVLWVRGVHAAIVFHDAIPYKGTRWKDRLRNAAQTFVMRRAYAWSERSILTVPQEMATWLPVSRRKAAFIPVGANISGTHAGPKEKTRRTDQRTIAVFGVTGAPVLRRDVDMIAHAVRRAAEAVPSVRLLVLGRHAEDAAAPLRAALTGTQVELEIHGVLPAEEIERRLSEADAMLFVRGGISSRRGSALAGIACGLPVVAFEGAETGAPLTEAGIVLVREGDRDALGDALARVLRDDALRGELSRRSFVARDKYFSWDVIAASFLQVLNRG
jgi:glycosyltransferase involved in cell wall biosynthesis